MSYCPKCGKENPTNDRYCRNCGFDFGSAADTETQNPYKKAVPQQSEQPQYFTPTSDKSRRTALILSLPGLGIQYFYVGRIIKGIICSFVGLCCWSGIIAAFFDEKYFFWPNYVILVLLIVVPVIQLLTGTFRDASKLPLKKD